MDYERETVTLTHQTGNRKFIRVIDRETGEPLHEFWEEVTKKPRGRPVGGKQPNFFRVYRTNWRDLVLRRRLTMAEAGFLFHLMAFVSWESNYLIDPASGRNLSESDIADLLGMSRGGVSRALTALNDKGLVALVKKGRGLPNHLMLNSHLILFGKSVKNIDDHNVFSETHWKPPVEVKHRKPQGQRDPA